MIKKHLTFSAVIALTSITMYADEQKSVISETKTEQKVTEKSDIPSIEDYITNDAKCAQQNDLEIIKKDIAELKQSIQSIIQKINNESHDYTALEQKIIDFDAQITIKGESIINEVNNKLATFADKQKELLKEINASVNLQPTVSNKDKLLTPATVTTKNNK